MMYNFAIFCKTYSGDFERFQILINSFNKFNVDNIPMYVSAPKSELKIFKNFESNNIKIISDESYGEKYLIKEKINNFSTGYINQEICKLCFFETGFAKNYLCIDSDAEFIRNFYISDFMHDENTPYTVLVMDKDLSVEKYYRDYWKERQKQIIKIYNETGLIDKRYRTCHNMQVFSTKVLKSLKEDFMKQKGYSYADLIKISPFEFSWYNAWFQKCRLVEEYAVEPFFKMFHMRTEYQISRAKGIKKKDLAKSYVGIVMNGNWQTPEKQYKKPNVIHKAIYKILSKI